MLLSDNTKSGLAAFILSNVACDCAVQVMSDALNIFPFASPRAMAPPILPAPIIVIFMSPLIYNCKIMSCKSMEKRNKTRTFASKCIIANIIENKR